MLRPLPVLPTQNPGPAPGPAGAKVSDRRHRGLKRAEGIAVTKAGDRHCRWPVGDPRSPDFRFCGCPAYESLPYCINHARVAYQNIGKKHRAAESDAPSEFRCRARRATRKTFRVIPAKAKVQRER